MFSTLAYAQEPAAAAQPGMMSFLPFIMIFVVLYFLLIRPQQKKQKALDAAISTLKAGDQVITTSGFFATIDSVIDASTFMINLGSIKVKIVRSGIAGKVDPHANMPTMEKK